MVHVTGPLIDSGMQYTVVWVKTDSCSAAVGLATDRLYEINLQRSYLLHRLYSVKLTRK